MPGNRVFSHGSSAIRTKCDARSARPASATFGATATVMHLPPSRRDGRRILVPLRWIGRARPLGAVLLRIDANQWLQSTCFGARRYSLPRGKGRVGELSAAANPAIPAETPGFPHLDPPPQAGEEGSGGGGDVNSRRFASEGGEAEGID